jgi:hypothetical protein
MNPQASLTPIEKLVGFFPQMPKCERELVEHFFQTCPPNVVEAVVKDYATETTTFDRVKLFKLLRQEIARLNPPKSPIPEWKNAKASEDQSIQQFLKRQSRDLVDGAIQTAREKYPDLFQMLRSDPLQTDIGRSIVYAQLHHKK